MNHIDGSSALSLDGYYTLADWRTWPADERWELVNGRPFAMSPAPRVQHQEKAFDLGRRLGNFLEGKPCKVFMAPLDVFLDDATADDTTADDATADDTTAEGAVGDEAGGGGNVVEPDVLAVCDPARIHDDGIHGAPDFVAEVLSDGTANRDFGIKRELYERNGVREYWIIQPETSTVFQYLLDGSSFALAREHRRGTTVASAVFPGFTWLCP
jgi:Uma2 family endonuclease